MQRNVTLNAHSQLRDVGALEILVVPDEGLG
jgi:hypothetical protein